MTDERVVSGRAPARAVILDASVGDELARVKTPVPVVREGETPPGQGRRPASSRTRSSRAAAMPGASCLPTAKTASSCASSRRPGGAEDRVEPFRSRWSPALDACDGATVLVTTVQRGGTSLVALARETGERPGASTDVRGYWPARDGSPRLEVSATRCVATIRARPRRRAGAT